MGNSTQYDVMIRARFEDRATKNALALNAGLEKVAHSASGLQHELWNLARHGITEAFGEGYRALIGFNAEMEQTKIGLAAMMEMNLGGSFQDAQVQADKLFTEFQRFSKLTPVTTREMTEFSRGIAAATFGATGNYQDLVNVTEQGVIASKVFGVESSLAQIQLSELLMGNVRKTERFGMMLLSAGHMSAEAFRELSAGQRLSFVKDVLNSDALKEATKAFSASFTGVTSTLKDNFEITMGKVGLPLFHAITEEIKTWNEWIERNGTNLESMAHKFSDGLVDGFHAVRDAVGFIIDHREVLLAIGAGFVALDPLGGGGKFAKGARAGIGRGAAGFALGEALGGDTVSSSFMALGGVMSVLPGQMGALGVAVTAVTGGIIAMSSEIDRQIERDAAEKAKSKSIVDWSNDLANGKLFGRTTVGMLGSIEDQAKREGFVKNGFVDQKSLLKSIGYQLPTTEGLAGQAWKSVVGDDVRRMLTQGMSADEAQRVIGGGIKSGDVDAQRALIAMATVIEANLPEQAKLAKEQLGMLATFNKIMGGYEGLGVAATPVLTPNAPEKPKYNITIQHLEIQSEDPDRIMFGIIEISRDAVRNPGQAKNVYREGG